MKCPGCEKDVAKNTMKEYGDTEICTECFEFNSRLPEGAPTHSGGGTNTYCVGPWCSTSSNQLRCE